MLVLIATFSSCLKSRNDLGGMLDDKGQVITSILEQNYLDGDAKNVGFHWVINSFFDINSTPNEAVKFFTLHVTQVRETKMNGPLTVKVQMLPLTGTTPFPAGAVTIKDIVIPQSSADVIDYPVQSQL